MTVRVELPEMVKLVDANGMVTPEGMRLFDQIVRAIAEQQTTTTDHETRITALEP